MIIEGLINICVGIIIGFFELIEISGIPMLSDAAYVLVDFCIYGSYVVGGDMLLAFGGLVVAWSAAKLSVGIGIRLWELLPLT